MRLLVVIPYVGSLFVLFVAGGSQFCHMLVADGRYCKSEVQLNSAIPFDAAGP